MTTPPGKHYFTLYQGATFSHLITWKDENGALIDLTGYSARMQAREEIESESAFLDLTTENGGITLGGEDGTIALFMAAEDTANVAVSKGIYDLEIISPDGFVTRLLAGKLCVSKEVTR